MQALSFRSKRVIVIVVAVCVAFAFTSFAQMDYVHAASKTYYAGLNSKVKVAYSKFKKDTTQTWTNADFSDYKKELADVQAKIAEGETEYYGEGPNLYAYFGTIQQKVTAKVSVGKLTTKQPKKAFIAFGKLKSSSVAQSKYKKIKKKINKKPINYCNYSYFEIKNYPKLTIKIGGESFAYFDVGYITLSKAGKIKKTKTTSSGKYDVGVAIFYKNGTTNEEVAKFLTALTSLKDNDTIEYSFVTPKTKSKGITRGFGQLDPKEKVDVYTEDSVTYSGYKSVSNKKFDVTETVRLKQ